MGLVARYATVACLSMQRPCNAPLRSIVSRNLCCLFEINMWTCACVWLYLLCVWLCVCVSMNTDCSHFADWQQTSTDEGNAVTSIDLLQCNHFCKSLTSEFFLPSCSWYLQPHPVSLCFPQPLTMDVLKPNWHLIRPLCLPKFGKLSKISDLEINSAFYPT